MPVPPRMGARPAGATGSVEVTGERTLSLQFTGSVMEYFRIWIVNVCLTVLTLGIFSAWAKVRKKRYFYSNTLLDGTPFQYLGQAIPILKGRIIAVIMFGAWYAGTHFFIALLPVVLVLAFIFAPWVIVRAAAFNARYSAFRNMTFNFSGTYWGAVVVIYGWALFVVFTFGIAFSWWQQRMKRFMVSHMQFGGVNGEFSATGGQFFKTYTIIGLLMGVAGAVLFGIVSAMFSPKIDKSSFLMATTITSYALYVAMYAYMQTRVTNLVWNHTRLGPLQFHSKLRARGMLWLYISNAIAILGTAGLLIPWATIRTIKYRLDHFGVTADDDLHAFQGSSNSAVQAAGAEVGEIFDFDMSI